MSNGLYPDQDRHSVGPDLDSNCLQRLSADDSKGRVKRLVKFRKLERCMYILNDNTIRFTTSQGKQS